MTMQHHGDREELETLRRFIDEAAGTAERQFPNGRIGADDDGTLTYAIALDARHRVVKIVFSHATSWIGLDQQAAEQLRDRLTEYLMELRGVKAG